MAQPQEQLRVKQFDLDLIVASYQKGIFFCLLVLYWFHHDNQPPMCDVDKLLNPEAVVCCMAKTSSRKQIQVGEHRS